MQYVTWCPGTWEVEESHTNTYSHLIPNPETQIYKPQKRTTHIYKTAELLWRFWLEPKSQTLILN